MVSDERFQRALQEVLLTPPASCKSSAQVETHTLTQHKHTLMFILGMKSFLRFYSNVAVVAHDDGTLTQQDKQLLQEHIQGIRIIESDEGQALVEHALQDKPNILKCNLTFPNTRQFFDYPLSSKNCKLISFDSDLLFAEQPQEIIDWIEEDTPSILYNSEDGPYNPYTELTKRFAMLPDFNFGLACYYKDVIDWDQMDELLGVSSSIQSMISWGCSANNKSESKEISLQFLEDKG